MLPKTKHPLERGNLTIDGRVLCPFLLLLVDGAVRWIMRRNEA